VAKRIATVWPTITGARQTDLRRPVRRLLRAARRGTAGLLRPGVPEAGEPTLDGQRRGSGIALIARPQTALPPHLLERGTLEAVSRQESRAVYVGEQTLLCRVLGKYLIYADAQETGITPHLAMDGYWESWITIALARMLRPGWHCLDVGANHGYYTLIMADAVGPQGRVVPVEPTPRLAELLRQTLDVNGFPGVTVASTAATDTDGEMLQLVIPARRSMNARLAQVAGPTDVAVEVETVTVDTLTRDWPRVDLIKIDVEGAEEGVWEGMQRTVAQNRDLVVILELNVDRYEDPRGFLETIELAGFPLRFIDFDAEVKDVTIDRLLRRRVGEDWMLYLARR
jgi:FkbM family methyltransferase